MAYLARQGETEILNHIFRGAENKPNFDKYDHFALIKRLGLEGVSVNTERHYQGRVSTFNVRDKTVDISDYDKLYGPFSYFNSEKKKGQDLYIGDALSITGENYLLKFANDEGLLKEFDIKMWVQSLQKVDGLYQLQGNPFIIYQNDKELIAMRVVSINQWGRSREGDGPTNIALDFSVLTSGF